MPVIGLFLVLPILIGAAATCVATSRTGASRDHLLVSILGLIVPALVGAKAESLLERGQVGTLAWELTNGFRYPGGIVGLLAMLPVIVLAVGLGRAAALADTAALAIPLAMATARVGCFAVGCCHGGVTMVPWAVVYPSGSIAWQTHVNNGLVRADALTALPVHPLQLYFIGWSLGLAAFLWWFAPRRGFAGQVALLYLALDNLAKLALELLRDPPIEHLRWMSLVLASLGVAGLTAGLRWHPTRVREA